MKDFDGYAAPATVEQLQWDLAQLRQWAREEDVKLWQYAVPLNHRLNVLRADLDELQRRVRREGRIVKSRRRIP